MDVKPPANRLCAVEGRNMVAVTHLALLGVKIQDSAFRAIRKKKQSFKAAAFVVIMFVKDGI